MSSPDLIRTTFIGNETLPNPAAQAQIPSRAVNSSGFRTSNARSTSATAVAPGRCSWGDACSHRSRRSIDILGDGDIRIRAAGGRLRCPRGPAPFPTPQLGPGSARPRRHAGRRRHSGAPIWARSSQTPTRVGARWCRRSHRLPIGRGASAMPGLPDRQRTAGPGSSNRRGCSPSVISTFGCWAIRRRPTSARSRRACRPRLPQTAPGPSSSPGHGFLRR